MYIQVASAGTLPDIITQAAQAMVTQLLNGHMAIKFSAVVTVVLPSTRNSSHRA